MSTVQAESSGRSKRGSARSATADRAELLRLRLDSARRAFPSDRMLAQALGVSPSQVARWRKGQEPDLENLDRLVGLDAVVEMLTGVFTEGRVAKWLTGPNANLGDRTPLTVLRQGDLPAVIGAVRVLKSGAFA